jgi:rhomboid family protein
MIPVSDVIPSRTTPWINLTLIVVNTAAFLYETTLAYDARVEFLYRHGLVPADFTWTAATTSMFVHESLLHVAANLLALWIFGDNVEDRLGHGRYLVFYLLAGYMSGLAEVWAWPASNAPLVGASGAVAGVMGAYVMMFPRSRVLLLVPIILFFDVVEIPAVLLLATWFLLQVAGGFGRVGPDPIVGGVTLWSHLGGFVTGLAAVRLFRRREREKVEWWSA